MKSMRNRCEEWKARVDLAALRGDHRVQPHQDRPRRRDLGDGEAMILRNHGLLTCGKTVGEAFNWCHRLELACRSQLAAMATGAKLQPVPKKVLEATYLNYQPQTRRPYGVMEWPALLRKLDRLDATYKD